MGSLPVPETSFVGRAMELAETASVLARPNLRLLVLTGPGGVGKTRLALAAADAVAGRFRDGVVFVGLAPLSHPARFVPEVAVALGVPESDDRPTRDPLLAFLRTRQMLLVLDNFETVTAAAPDLGSLLAACRGVTALVTSRSRLGLPGEVTVPVEPLPLAQPSGSVGTEDAAQSEAVRLFVERAKAADPAATLTPAMLPDVLAICRRLEGLPLAIELAAARLRSSSCAELLAQLGASLVVLDGGSKDAPARLRTMRDAVAWSERLLPPDLRALFRRLAVFRGGFDIHAAEAVAVAAFGEADTGGPGGDVDPPTSAVTKQLTRLVDHSLLRFEPLPALHRYGMLEVVREFAWERLAEAGELAAARRAHADHFLALAARTRPLMFTRSFRQAITTLVVDQHNFRAALAWARDANETGVCLRLCVALWEFWYQCGFVAEGRGEIEAALAEGTGNPIERQGALSLAGFLAWLQGDTGHAERRFGEALAVAETLGNPWLVATVRNGLALVAWQAGNTAAMRRHAGAAHPVVRAAGDEIAEAISLVVLAIADRLDGRLDEAAALFVQGRRLAEQSGFLWLAAAAGFGSGEVALDRGHEDDATGHYRASLAITADLGDRWGIGAAVGGIACVAALRGDPEQAARLFAVADALLASGRTFLPTLNRARYDHLKDAVRDQVPRRAFARLAAVAGGWDTGRTIAEAVALASRFAGADGGAPGATVSEVQLTARERDVLRLLVAGHQDPEIADALKLSRRTVSDHVRRLLKKCGQPTRTALAVQAVRQGLI